MTIGFDRDSFVLPFADRGSFQTKMIGWTGRLALNEWLEGGSAAHWLRWICRPDFGSRLWIGGPDKMTRDAAVDEIARRWRAFVFWQGAPLASAHGKAASNEENMRVGIATDHGGLGLKEDTAVHDVVDGGAESLDPADDDLDFVVPPSPAVAAREGISYVAY